MTFRFAIQPGGQLVVAVFEGEMTLESEQEALTTFAQHPGVNLMADLLVDRRRAVSVVPPNKFNQRLDQARATFSSEGDGRPRMAIIVPNDLEFGMARMFELQGAERVPHEVRVVRSVEEACDWLRVAPDALVWPEP